MNEGDEELEMLTELGRMNAVVEADIPNIASTTHSYQHTVRAF
jgi:hypothetical protein